MTDKNLISDREHGLTPQRVKIYQLNTENVWEDIGTGFCFYYMGEDEKPDQMIIRSEDDDSVLLTSDVLKRRLYQKQQDTLIVWTEDDNRDLALSFQDCVSCDLIWNHINKQQQEGVINNKGIGGNNGGEMDDGNEDDYSLPADTFSENITLPTVSTANLNETLAIISSAKSIFEKDSIAGYITAETTDYLGKFLSLFEVCENGGKIEHIHLIHSILVSMFYCLVILNNHTLIAQLISEENIMKVLGILEYNPNTPKIRAKHRQFVREKCDARLAIELDDRKFKRWINQMYQVDYLLYILTKDLRQITAGVVKTVDSIIIQNRIEIVIYFQRNDALLGDLFYCDDDKKDDAILFIHEVCELSKQMDSSAQLKFFRKLSSYGLLDLMCRSLVHSSSHVRSISVRQLQSFIELDVDGGRYGLLTQAGDHKQSSLIQVIVEQAAADSDYDLKIHYFEILRLLLDPYSSIPNNRAQTINVSNRTSPDTLEFIRLFYKRYMDALLKPISEFDVKSPKLKGPIEPLYLTLDQAQLCQHICDLLSLAVKNHGRHIRYNILHSDIIKRVIQLYRSKYTYIKLSALRFIRTCISASDANYNQVMINENAFEPTIRVLLDTNGRDCLLNSAFLELFEYIRKENIKALVDHLIIKFGTVLDTVTYVSAFKDLRLRYEQNIEIQETSSVDLLESNLDRNVNHDGWYSSTVDDGEEDYFNTSDEEQETSIDADEQSQQDTAIDRLIAQYDTNSDGVLDMVIADESDDYLQQQEITVNSQKETVVTVQEESADIVEQEHRSEKQILSSNDVDVKETTFEVKQEVNTTHEASASNIEDASTHTKEIAIDIKDEEVSIEVVDTKEAVNNVEETANDTKETVTSIKDITTNIQKDANDIKEETKPQKRKLSLTDDDKEVNSSIALKRSKS
ncbi:MAG: component of IIS longevity pathway SMK-1-domain-containing protein [Benjaminiella poitrasii]|nr:MAG: component of IIS longevity pathway SMK-1-domain-containing protein [Benjaminiella poitrasii]